MYYVTLKITIFYILTDRLSTSHNRPGTVHSIQACNKTVKSFFVLNRHTCEDWFTRIRPAIAEVNFNLPILVRAGLPEYYLRLLRFTLIYLFL